MTDPYRIRTPETWDAARADYLAGHTAQAVCARYDLGESSFHKRAAREGWRRADQPDPAPLDDDADDLPDADLPGLVELALKRMAVAARRGRAADALRWQRFHGALEDRMERATQAARQSARQAERVAETSDLAARKAEAHQTWRTEREARIERVLPPDADERDRLAARLDDILTHGARPRDIAEQIQDVQEIHSVLTTPAGQTMLDRAERRRRLREARKRS